MEPGPVAPKSGEVVSTDVWGSLDRLRARLQEGRKSSQANKEIQFYKELIYNVWLMAQEWEDVELTEYLEKHCPWLNEG